MAPMSRPMKLMVILLGVGVVGASLVLGVMCLITSPFAWVLFGFELIGLIAGVFTLVMGLRGRADALALACLGGTVFVGAILGHMGTNPPAIGGMPLLGWTLARLAMAFGLGALAALMALESDRQAWGRLIKGAVLGVPVAAAFGAMSVGRVRGPIMDAAMGLPPIVQALGAVVVFMAGLILISVSVHLTISAFSGRQAT